MLDKWKCVQFLQGIRGCFIYVECSMIRKNVVNFCPNLSHHELICANNVWISGDPNCAGPNGNVNPNANIDLGALYQQTVENRVTRWVTCSCLCSYFVIQGVNCFVLLIIFKMVIKMFSFFRKPNNFRQLFSDAFATKYKFHFIYTEFKCFSIFPQSKISG